jgi:hypothetical protein
MVDATMAARDEDRTPEETPEQVKVALLRAWAGRRQIAKPTFAKPRHSLPPGAAEPPLDPEWVT